MKQFVKISLLLGTVFLTFVVGLGIGLGLGIFRPQAQTISRINPVMRVERPFVEEIVIDDLQAEIDRSQERIDDMIRSRESGRLVWGDPPVITPPEAPVFPPSIVVHRGPGFFGWLGSLINAVAAAAIIVIGVWLVMRRSRPHEKTPQG